MAAPSPVTFRLPPTQATGHTAYMVFQHTVCGDECWSQCLVSILSTFRPPWTSFAAKIQVLRGPAGPFGDIWNMATGQLDFQVVISFAHEELLILKDNARFWVFPAALLVYDLAKQRMHCIRFAQPGLWERTVRTIRETYFELYDALRRLMGRPWVEGLMVPQLPDLLYAPHPPHVLTRVCLLLPDGTLWRARVPSVTTWVECQVAAFLESPLLRSLTRVEDIPRRPLYLGGVEMDPLGVVGSMGPDEQVCIVGNGWPECWRPASVLHSMGSAPVELRFHHSVMADANFLRTALNAWLMCSVHEMIWAALSRRPDGPHCAQWRVARVLHADEGGGVTRTERIELTLRQKPRKDTPCLLEVSRDADSVLQSPCNIPPSYMLIGRFRVTERLFVAVFSCQPCLGGRTWCGLVLLSVGHGP